MDVLWLEMLVLLLPYLGRVRVRAYPSGAPTGACEDMMPRHMGVQPQTSPAPYAVLADRVAFSPGGPVTVTIVGPDYRGVLLEARTPGDTAALGTWLLPPPDTRFLECSGNPQGAVTHANTNVKGNSTVFSWTPPDTARPIYFMATVAQQRTVYWLNVRSSALFRAKAPGLGLASGTEGVAPGGTLLSAALCWLLCKTLL
ncbi:putative defense protein Hdd11 [Eucyclogobius newberryi]|uniref:putative defense protein Hdd11 n=1 Tax=Eucyclogobius newberryi TaxID=166745 RepID=UPI003B5B1EDF